MKVLWMALVVALQVGTARAGEVFPEELGLVEFLPVADVIADGVTPVALHVLALDGEGEGIVGIEAKPMVSSGEIKEWKELGGGMYRLMWIPPRAEVSSMALIRVKGKTLLKDTFKRSVSLRLHPWTKTAMTVAINPTVLSAGKVDTATLNVVLADTLTATNASDLKIRVSDGAILDMTPMGENRFTARYEAPETRKPLLALVTIADGRRVGRSYGAFAIPISVSHKATVKAPADSDVLLKVAGREFGPIKSSKRGRAELEVLVGPGIAEGEVSVMNDGDWKQETYAFDFSSSRRIQWIPMAEGIPGDASGPIPVRFAVFDATGQPDENASVSAKVSIGSLSEPEYEGDGIYVATYTPPNLANADQLVLSASVEGEEGQTDEITVPMVPVRPERLTLTPSTGELGGSKEVSICAMAEGPEGLNLSHQPIAWNLTGGTADGPPTQGKDGCSSVTVKTYGAGLSVIASSGSQSTNNPVDRIGIIHSGDGVPADGISSIMLRVMSLDQYGYPVSGVPITLALEGGDGSIPPSVVTDEQGFGEVFYTAGRNPGLVRVRATAGQMSGVLGFLQGPPVLSGRELPRSGAEEVNALEVKWRQVIETTRVAP
jgi:hypothetical protein